MCYVRNRQWKLLGLNFHLFNFCSASAVFFELRIFNALVDRSSVISCLAIAICGVVSNISLGWRVMSREEVIFCGFNSSLLSALRIVMVAV